MMSASPSPSLSTLMRYRTELEEVRAAERRLQRQVVGDDGDRAGIVRRDERVDVGVVGHRILADRRCLAMG
jgi:hypothetical protein